MSDPEDFEKVAATPDEKVAVIVKPDVDVVRNGHCDAHSLATLLSKCRGQRHAVLLQDFPDPDAISCGQAYRMIAEEFAIDCDLLYSGRISHQENVALINLLDIDLMRWDFAVNEPDRYQGCLFVDNQGTTCSLTNLFLEADIPVVAIVDHHTLQDQSALMKPAFFDVRQVGACATIFAEYIEQGLLNLEPTRPEHRHLVTALMHGIVSDTGAMIRAHPADFRAAAFLQPYFESDLLLEITHQKRTHKSMEVIRIALADRVTRAGLCLAGVGYLRAADRDAIPQAADFLLSEENVHTVIVYGIVQMANGEEMVSGSLRTSKHTLAPDSFLKETLGQDVEGKYYGGGKEMAGGFEIPLGFLAGRDSHDLAKLKWKAFSQKIRKKFFYRIGVDDV